MFRAAVRTAPRVLRQPASAAGRRFASTAPADKRYTWKGSATRWVLAAGALYWYNTSPIFADELPSRYSTEPPQFSENDLPTVDAIVEGKRKQLDARLKAKEQEKAAAAKAKQPTPPESQNDTTAAIAAPGDAEKTPEQLEEEAGQQGAFNPETGEINWDCPCLGGMAHGPCGEEFKAAFSCFVYSDEEPKGMDCIDKFQHMQDCFRKYPDVYGAEIADEDAAEAEAAALADDSPAPATETKDAAPSKDAAQTTPAPSDKEPQAAGKKSEAHEYTTEEHKAGPTDAPKSAHPVAPAAASEAVDKSDSQPQDDAEVDSVRGVPKNSFDATAANDKASK